MIEEFNIYKDKILNFLKNKKYSKKTPLNTKTSQFLLKDFIFNNQKTYIEINTLNKEDKEKIIDLIFEFIKIKQYKNFFDIYFRLDDNNINDILNIIDEYNPESITIYESIDNEEFEKLIKKGSSLSNHCNLKIALNFEEQTIKINYNKNNKDIVKQIKKVKKYFE